MQDRAEDGQIIGDLLRPPTYSMPYWIKLPPNDSVEISVQCRVQCPVLHLQACICLSQLSDTHLDTFKYSILNVLHSVGHGYFKLNDFCLSLPLQASRNCSMKPWPQRWLSQKEVSHHA